ncbi:MAG TPA: tetratricopeptide repeat protein [Gemmataceae bacterium]|nr:tetratricopeptide repeat protein [Gemmataceae bacterium]
MVLQSFFEEQLRSLRIFLDTPGAKLRVLLTDEDTKAVIHRLLAGMENDERVPHVFIPSDAPFTAWGSFFEHAYADLVESYTPFGNVLSEECILAPPEWATLKGSDPAERFARGVSLFANALPEEVGAVVFLIDPADVTNPAGYRKALRFLAEQTPSEWVKYVVLDDRLKGHTAELVKQMPKVGVQSMYLAPEEMEKRVKWALTTGIGVTAAERRAYTGLLAGFALSRKEHDAALTLQREQLEMTRTDGTPAERAGVHYNLGNVQLARKDYPAAVEAFGAGLQFALDAGLTPFIPVILTNLGVAFFHAGDAKKTAACFEIARLYCRQLNQPPVEAHVLDCMARCHLAANRPAEAEGCWKEALAVYDRITAGPLKFARDGGRKDILAKLEHHYQSTHQEGKLAGLREEVARASAR